VVSRYGEFVLLRPRLSAATLALWGGPAVVGVLGIIATFVYTRRRANARVEKLTPEEEARLGRLLEGD